MKNKFLFYNICIYFVLFSINFFVFFCLENISDIKIYILLFNILLGILFIMINFYFYKDLQLLKDLSKNMNITDDNFCDLSTLKNDFTFKEAYTLEKTFKKLILKNNLIHKDLQEMNEFHKKFLPQDIYAELGIKGLNKINLWNFKIKKIAIMFIDVVWFTSISEQVTPERALFLLNIYFDGIGEIIMKNNGYIDKYLWDGIMVIFESENIDNSIKASIEITEFIEKFKIWELGKKIQIWVWINYWEVILWTIGTKKRMEATVIWDTINTASRLQDLTRSYGCNIIISEHVYKNLSKKEIYSIKSLGVQELRGKQKKMEIYCVEPYYLI